MHLAVQRDAALAHDRLEMEELPRPMTLPLEPAPIPRWLLAVHAARRLEADLSLVDGVRQGDALRCLEPVKRELPAGCQRLDATRRGEPSASQYPALENSTADAENAATATAHKANIFIVLRTIIPSCFISA